MTEINMTAEHHEFRTNKIEQKKTETYRINKKKWTFIIGFFFLSPVTRLLSRRYPYITVGDLPYNIIGCTTWIRGRDGLYWNQFVRAPRPRRTTCNVIVRILYEASKNSTTPSEVFHRNQKSLETLLNAVPSTLLLYCCNEQRKTTSANRVRPYYYSRNQLYRRDDDLLRTHYPL